VAVLLLTSTGSPTMMMLLQMFPMQLWPSGQQVVYCWVPALYPHLRSLGHDTHLQVASNSTIDKTCVVNKDKKYRKIQKYLVDGRTP
jgi:hypothetical protein